MTNEPKHINILDQPQVVEEGAEDAISMQLSKKVNVKWREAVIAPTEYLDPSRPFTPPDWAMSVRGVPFYAFGDYNYLQGQAGNGKSFTICIYEAVALGAKFGELMYIGNREKPKVLHVDTEQSEGNVQLHMRRVYHLAGWQQGSDHSDQYRVLMLRETPAPRDRWAKVIKACHEFRPDFLFLDGMLDVVDSMNKEEDCNQVISEAGAISSIFKLCMTGICHENPSNPKAKDNDGPPKPAGHIGSYSQRKGSAGQGTSKMLNGTDATFRVTPKKVRNKDYEGWGFGVSDTPIEIDGKIYKIGIPYWIDGATNSTDDTPDEYQPIKDAMLALQWNVEGMRYTELESALRSYGITSKRKLGDYITLAQQIGVIHKNEDTKRYMLVYDNGPRLDTQISIDNNSLGDDDGGAPF